MSFPAAILKSHAVRVAVAAATLVAGSAQAANTKLLNFALEMRARVPLACYLTVNGTFVAPTQANTPVSMGTVSEFCNSPAGYQITASYDGNDLAGASLILDSRKVDLTSSGLAVLLDSNLPGKATRLLSFVPSNPAQTGNISLSISSKV